MKIDKDLKHLAEAYQKIQEMAVRSTGKTSTILNKKPNKYGVGIDYVKLPPEAFRGEVTLEDDPEKEIKLNITPHRDGDYRLFTDKGRLEKYGEHLVKNAFRKIPFDFNIIFQDYEIHTEEEERSLPVDKEQDSITIFMSNNASTIRNPSNGKEKGSWQHTALTPWMIAHRIAHNMTDGAELFRNKITRQSMEPIQIQFDKDTKEIIYDYLNRVNKNWKNENIGNTIRNPIFGKISNFKSARDGVVNGVEEYIHELIASYIVQGKITFNPLPTAEIANKAASDFQNCITNMLERLKGCYGVYAPHLNY